MAPELTLEEMAKKIDDLTKVATNIKTAQDEKDEKDKEAKHAQDEKKEEERKEARKASRGRRDAAIRLAMEEKDDEKKDAAIKRAQDEYDKEHKAMDEKDEKHDAMDNDEHEPKDHEAMTDDEKKEHEAQIASIVGDKKWEIDSKILAAAKVMNPTGVEALAKELKKNKFTASKKMLDDMTKIYGEEFIGSVQNIPSVKTETPAPYFMAGAMNPQDVDANQLNANSPDSEFAKLSTEELLKMGEA